MRFGILFQFLALLSFLFLVACGGAQLEVDTSRAIDLPAPALASEVIPTATPLAPEPTAAVPADDTPAPGGTEMVDRTATPTPDAPVPAEHYITGIYGHKQYFSLGCEASVAKDWAAFFGVEINEFNFQIELPLSDNPDKGFVGDVHGPWGQIPPYAYGVHAVPVAALLREYGLPAGGYKQLTVEQIKAELAEGHPVIAWVIGNVVGGVPAEYTDKEGDTTIVAAYEHVVLVTGYNETSLRYNSNGKFYDVPIEVFENSWGVLGNMAIFYEEENAENLPGG